MDRDFNFWQVLAPYAEKLVSEEVKGTNWLAEAGTILQTLIALPRKTENVLDLINRGGLEIQMPAAERRLIQIEHTINRALYGILFFAFLNSGVQLYLEEQTAFAGVLLGGAGLSLLAALLPRKRRHRP